MADLGEAINQVEELGSKPDTVHRFKCFQDRVMDWCDHVFKGMILWRDPMERARRFYEESTELVQAMDLPYDEALAILNYSYGRPKGVPRQEIGGAMVTLFALGGCIGEDVNEAAEEEYNRIMQPEVVEKIRAKQVSKQLHGIGGTPING